MRPWAAQQLTPLSSRDQSPLVSPGLASAASPPPRASPSEPTRIWSPAAGAQPGGVWGREERVRKVGAAPVLPAGEASVARLGCGEGPSPEMGLAAFLHCFQGTAPTGS